MKARILTSIIAIVFSVTLLNAGNPKSTMYTNTELTESGVVKECTFVENKTLRPIQKIVYKYDVLGNIKERTYYKWEDHSAWVNVHKYTYEYNEYNQVANLIHTKWDASKKGWSDRSDYIINKYNSDGEFLTVEQILLENNDLAQLK
ncbi:MAG: DUF3836 domain-containing protein [Dysgonomonas sp.]|nr:DUF3836 domain-containing protein [Dysgonomonas sp.]